METNYFCDFAESHPADSYGSSALKCQRNHEVCVHYPECLEKQRNGQKNGLGVSGNGKVCENFNNKYWRQL